MKFKHLLLLCLTLLAEVPALPQGKVTRPGSSTTRTPLKQKKPTTKPTSKPVNKPKNRNASFTDQLVVTSLNVGNTNWNGDVLTPYGGTLYASSLRMVQGKLEYTGLNEQVRKKIYVRVIDPDGNIEKMDNSPAGYTFVCEMPFYTGSNWVTTNSWGSADPGHFRRGNYVMEWWIDGKCIASKSFYVY